MARIISNYAFDQSNLDLNRLYSNSLDANLLDNSFLSYNGITYQDAYIVDWYLGGNYASVFGGYGITVDSFQNVTGGTVTGYLELFWNGSEYVASYAIEDISVQAVNLYSAAVSSSIFDDYTLIDNLLGGADNFFLSNQSDFAYGLGGNDVLVGYGGNDWLYGDSGNDSLTGGAGSDQIYGGDGIDTAFYSGSQSSYSLLLNLGGAIVLDRREGGEGSDEVIGVEYLDFDTDLFGSPFNLTSFGGATGLSASDFESFIELYIAYFNRSPDAIGLNFWGTAYANGTSLQEMATLFADQPETLAAYPVGTTNLQFATTVYNNVLGRTPDQSGLDFWVGQLDSGSVTKDQFILEVLGGVQAGSPDRSYLDDKVDIGAYFAVHKGMSDTDNASAAMALFDGTEASIDTAVTEIDNYYADALDPNNGEFLMQVVGVLDDPFAGI